MARYGLTVSGFGKPLHELAPTFQAMPDMGYDDVWSDENYYIDAFTPLAYASALAPKLRLGLSVAQVYTRGAAILAMSIAGLCQAAPGRVLVGLGASTKVIVEDWNGVPYVKPLSRVRDTIRFLRAALAGEKVDEEYDTFSVKRFRLAAKIEQPPPITIGAVRPRMLALAGEVGDGVILGNVSAEDCKQVIPIVKKGNPDAEIICGIIVAPGDVEPALASARWMLNEYLNAPVYAAAQEWLGHGDELRETWDKWKAGDRKGAAAALPQKLVDSIVLTGSFDEIHEKLQQYVDAGVDTLALSFLGGVDPMWAAKGLAPR